MNSGSNDLGDARSREEARTFRDRIDRGRAAQPEYAYAPRWIPYASRMMTRWDIFMVRLGAVLLGCALVAIAVRRIWF